MSNGFGTLSTQQTTIDKIESELTADVGDLSLVTLALANLNEAADIDKTQRIPAHLFERLLLGRRDTVAELRAVNATNLVDGALWSIKGHTTGTIGGGRFVLNKSGTIGADMDDDGLTIHAAGGPPVGDAGAWYWQRVFDEGRVTPLYWGAPVQPIGGIAQDCSAQFQAAMSSNYPVLVPTGLYGIGSTLIWETNVSIKGVDHFGQIRVKLERLAGATGPMFQVPQPLPTRTNSCSMANLYIEGNAGADTHIFDFTGMSYARMDNVWAERSSGHIAFCQATGGAGSTSDAIQWMFNQCRFNNSTSGSGLRVESGDANPGGSVAWSFTNCEFAGNGAHGVDLEDCSAFYFDGMCVAQQNTLREVRINTCHSIVWDGYVEGSLVANPATGGANGIEITGNSDRYRIDTRSSFGLGQTFVQNSETAKTRGRISIRGESNDEQYYGDPRFERWTGFQPYKFASVGMGSQNVSFGSGSDAKGTFLELTDNTLANGWVRFDLDRTYAELTDRWVTVAMEIDTTSFTAPTEWRIEGFVDGVVLPGNARFVTLKPDNFVGWYYADIQFVSGGAGTTPQIRFGFSWDSTPGGQTLRIRKMYVVDGSVQFHRNEPGPQERFPLSASVGELGIATSGINIHNKHVGRQVWLLDGVPAPYFALGPSPTDGWQGATVGSTITPA